MKRYIKLSSSNKIDSVRFCNELKEELYEVLPGEDPQLARNNYRGGYSELIVYDPPKLEDLISYVTRALDNLGYEVFNTMEDYDDEFTLIASDGAGKVGVTVDVGDYYDMGLLGYIDMDYNI